VILYQGGAPFPPIFGHNTLKGSWFVPVPFKIKKMGKYSHYQPSISREIIRVLYHERVRRKIPMTRLVENILTDALRNTESWRMMEDPPEIRTTTGHEQS